VSGRVVFLSDYDMLMAERLVQGIDLWINTPRRPWEACGTSGMKVLVNGGLNLSELDGWWAEAYSPAVGWAIGDGRDRGDDPSWDAAEADALYALLEGEIAAAFYVRDAHGIPRDWLARMRESMARLTPAFSANRTVREYTDTHYLPAAAAYRERAANGGRQGADLLAWRDEFERCWSAATFTVLDVHTHGQQHGFRVQVDLGELDPEGVRMELYAEGPNGGTPVRQPMTRTERLIDSTTRYVYVGEVPASRPASDFTPRLMPFHAGASVPLEAPFILWDARPR
jgi:glycogen phosphorylase